MEELYPVIPNSPRTTLTAPIDEDDDEIQVAELSILPPGPNEATLGLDPATAETVRYEDKSAESGPGSITGVTRGFQGTAIAWAAQTSISRTITAYDFDGLRQNINDATVLEDQTEGETLADYDLVRLASDGSWYLTDATAYSTTAGQIGVRIRSGTIQIAGKVTNPAWTLTVSKPVYISDTAGAPSSSPGANKRRIGNAVSATSFLLTPKFESDLIQAGITIFSDNINHLTVKTPIAFTAVYLSEYAIASYDWDFGDGSAHSSERSPVHTYTTADDYEAVLTLTDTQGNQKKARYSLNVHALSSTNIQGVSPGETVISRSSHVLNVNIDNFPDLPLSEEVVGRSSHVLNVNIDNFPDLPTPDPVISRIGHTITIVNT
jgi:PKD domain.